MARVFIRARGRVSRALVFTVASVVAVAAIGAFAMLQRSRVSDDEPPSTAEALARLVREKRETAAEPLRLSRVSTKRRLAIPEDVIAKLYPMVKRDNHEYDSFSYLRREPNLDVEKPWPEHPNSVWHLRSNSLGMREDAEVSATKPALRILVTGDSHTDGMCNNDESYSNLLEDALHAAHPDKTVEVLNAGKVGYSFYNYRGVLERFLELEPDVLVVAVYGGNDFEESLTIAHYLAGTDRPPGKELYKEELEAARKINWPCMSQGLVACKYFQLNPGEVELAMDVAIGITGDIVGMCEAHGIAPLFVYIPPMYEVEDDETNRALIAAMKLGERDVARFEEMGDRYLAALASLRVPALDLRPAFKAIGKGLYWKQDHHIDLAGHALIASELQPIVEPLLADPPR